VSGADPDAAWWRGQAADLAVIAQGRVRAAFAWIDAELAAGGSDGEIAMVIALSDLCAGTSIGAVIDGLILSADRAVKAGTP
jgi:hypothetical protein